MIFTIVGQRERERSEEIDTTETREGADYLLGEYQLAFGPEWNIWIEEQDDCAHSQGGQHE